MVPFYEDILGNGYVFCEKDSDGLEGIIISKKDCSIETKQDGSLALSAPLKDSAAVIGYISTAKVLFPGITEPIYVSEFLRNLAAQTDVEITGNVLGDNPNSQSIGANPTPGEATGLYLTIGGNKWLMLSGNSNKIDPDSFAYFEVYK